MAGDLHLAVAVGLQTVCTTLGVSGPVWDEDLLSRLDKMGKTLMEAFSLRHSLCWKTMYDESCQALRQHWSRLLHLSGSNLPYEARMTGLRLYS